jgi:cell cycle checkpoint protein
MDRCIYISPRPPYVRISSESSLGIVEVDIPRHSEIMEHFECDYPQTFKYRYTLMIPILKAVTLSSKTSLRLNDRGCLSLQFMIPIEEDKTSLVEYIVSHHNRSKFGIR